MLLVYPNRYSLGMSNLGFQTVYSVLNAHPDAMAERAFLPDPSDLAEYERTATPLFSMESQSVARQFDVVAFSISFEEDYLNIPKLLDLAGIPARAASREEAGEAYPLIVAGGAAPSLNPEPVADFFDAFIIGDGESAIAPLVKTFQDSSEDRDALLKNLASKEGFYIPSFYDWSFDGPLVSSLRPKRGAAKIVSALRNSDIDLHDVPHSMIISPETEFKDTALMEVQRGCGRGCRFCAAGFIYLPPRWRSEEKLTDTLDELLTRTNKIGLLGAAVSEHASLKTLLKRGIEAGAEMTLSSLRVDSIDEELLALLREAGYSTITLAPEAGTERMRAVINKGITDSEIKEAATMAARAGFSTLKLYFMVGLPGETDSDVEAIATLVKELKAEFFRGNITVSINPFIPKPFTPFQWHPYERVEVLKGRFGAIKDELKGLKGLKLKIFSEKEALFQAILARADRRAGKLIEEASRSGWRSALKAGGKELLEEAYRERDSSELLPWDVIDHGLKKSYLLAEYRRGLAAETTPPCEVGTCLRCGVC